MTETKPKTPTKKAVDYVAAIGRRKEATAKIRVYRKSGDMLVNGVAIGKYFPAETMSKKYLRPLNLTNTNGKLSFSIKVAGSGKMAQLVACTHALSRALIKIDLTYRGVLKKAGLLMRDPRMKESRKVGTGGKARRTKQSPKR